jgi:hypothetical protein
VALTVNHRAASTAGLGGVGPAVARVTNSPAWRPPFRSPPRQVAIRVGLPVEWGVTGCVFLAIVLMGTVSSTLLTHLKVHYLSNGGNFYEKFHPATYFIILAFLLTLVRNSDPIGEIDRVF